MKLATPEDGRWNALGVEFLLLFNNHISVSVSRSKKGNLQFVHLVHSDFTGVRSLTPKGRGWVWDVDIGAE